VIAVDTSALMAILQREPGFEVCMDVLEAETEVLISAGTLAEALIVAGRRVVAQPMNALIDGLGFTIAPVTAAIARRVAEAYGRWGKGVHPAGLNLGDCFAYALASEQGCPLLFVGDDFSKTDLVRASPPSQ
jgi:ribonuclease VapC